MKNIVLILVVFIFVGCSFKSSHERFISSMDTIIAYGNYQKYKTKLHRISDENLNNKEIDNNENTIYHYDMYYTVFKCHCKYHVIVNKYGVMTKWNFEPNCDKKCCVNLG